VQADADPFLRLMMDWVWTRMKARLGRQTTLRVSHSDSVLHGAFVWAAAASQPEAAAFGPGLEQFSSVHNSSVQFRAV
jgi:hypothetical protein